MSARIKAPTTYFEYSQLSDDQQYYLWLVGDVPANWYIGSNSSRMIEAEATNPEYDYEGWWSTSSSYVDKYECHSVLTRVEDAIREVNIDLNTTPRIITEEDK